jgi:RNA polymerase sigma factor (TIGR02999 family)
LTDAPNQEGEVTGLLRKWEEDKPDALDRLFEVVYPELRRISGALFSGEANSSLLQPTSVVNELFLKLVRQRSVRFEDRNHFYSLCARLMRRVLVDQARIGKRVKRDGGVSVPFEEGLSWVEGSPEQTLDIDRALDELEVLDPRKCRMVEFRLYLGFTAAETAELLATSKATVDRELRFARAWLHERLHSS